MLRIVLLGAALSLATAGIAAVPAVHAPAPVALRTTHGARSPAFADVPQVDETEATTSTTATTAAAPTAATTTTSRTLTTTAAKPKPTRTDPVNQTGDYGPESPGTVTVKYEAGRTQWETA